MEIWLPSCPFRLSWLWKWAGSEAVVPPDSTDAGDYVSCLLGFLGSVGSGMLGALFHYVSLAPFFMLSHGFISNPQPVSG